MVLDWVTSRAVGRPSQSATRTKNKRTHKQLNQGCEVRPADCEHRESLSGCVSDMINESEFQSCTWILHLCFPNSFWVRACLAVNFSTSIKQSWNITRRTKFGIYTVSHHQRVVRERGNFWIPKSDRRKEGMVAIFFSVMSAVKIPFRKTWTSTNRQHHTCPYKIGTKNRTIIYLLLMKLILLFLLGLPRAGHRGSVKQCPCPAKDWHSASDKLEPSGFITAHTSNKALTSLKVTLLRSLKREIELPEHNKG